MSIEFVTYFDRNYLAKGLSLHESLQRQAPGCKLTIVTMDEYTRVILSKLNLSNVQIIPFHEIENRDSELLKAREKRKTVEYLWTSTPSIILYMLENHTTSDYLVYVDADLYFFNSISPVIEEMADKSVLIHRHNFPQRMKHLEKFGVYNVGLVLCKKNRDALNVLRDWRNDCNEWCHDYEENGKFGDQGYLTNWTTRYDCVKVTENHGVGVAPWNQEQYKFSKNFKGELLIDNTPIVFYHFHSFKFLNIEAIIPAYHVEYGTNPEIINTVVIPYINSLKESIKKIQNIIPDFQCGLVDQNFSLTPQHTFIVTGIVAEELKDIELPHNKVQLDNQWTAYMGV